MSLLKKVFEAYNEHQAVFSQSEAIAAIAVSAIASDGYLLEQERERVIMLLSQMEMFKGYSEKQIIHMLNRLLNKLIEKGINNLVAMANDSLHPEYKKTALMLATDIILVDGVLYFREQEFLTRLCQIFKITPEKISKTFQVKSEIHQITRKKSKKYRINKSR